MASILRHAFLALIPIRLMEDVMRTDIPSHEVYRSIMSSFCLPTNFDYLKKLGIIVDNDDSRFRLDILCDEDQLCDPCDSQAVYMYSYSLTFDHALCHAYHRNVGYLLVISGLSPYRKVIRGKLCKNFGDSLVLFDLSEVYDLKPLSIDHDDSYCDAYSSCIIVEDRGQGA
ncbi:hypothetical protein RJT34_14629 [Clitoria ternatea]|uniref:Uncharacterized protein n=1 Tax=Clitoria ternatea TaxID=43366 RepID=A0AAN9JSV2_CLITE